MSDQSIIISSLVHPCVKVKQSVGGKGSMVKDRAPQEEIAYNDGLATFPGSAPVLVVQLRLQSSGLLQGNLP